MEEKTVSAKEKRQPLLPGPASLLSEAWGVYKRKYKVILIIAFIGLCLYGVLFAGFFAGGLLFATLTFTSGKLALPVIIVGILCALVVFIGMQILFGWNQLALLYVLKTDSNNWKEAYQKTKKFVLGYFWVMILYGLIVMGGYGLFIIPGVLFAFWFSQALFVLIDQDKRGFDALFISKAYVKGRFWALFGRLLALGLCILALQIPFSIVQSVLESADAPTGVRLLFSLAGSAFSLGVLTPLAAIYAYLLYGYLKKEKGAVTVTITKKTKIKYGVLCLVGIIVPIVFFGLIMIGIVAAIDQQRIYSMDSQRQLDTLQIEYGLELYYADNYLYPTKLSELTPAYVKTLPVDPKTHALYPYQLSEDGQSYSICPHFEKLQSGCSTGSSGIHTMNRHQVPPLRLPTSPAY